MSVCVKPSLLKWRGIDVPAQIDNRSCCNFALRARRSFGNNKPRGRRDVRDAGGALERKKGDGRLHPKNSSRSRARARAHAIWTTNIAARGSKRKRTLTAYESQIISLAARWLQKRWFTRSNRNCHTLLSGPNCARARAVNREPLPRTCSLPRVFHGSRHRGETITEFAERTFAIALPYRAILAQMSHGIGRRLL